MVKNIMLFHCLVRTFHLCWAQASWGKDSKEKVGLVQEMANDFGCNLDVHLEFQKAQLGRNRKKEGNWSWTVLSMIKG